MAEMTLNDVAADMRAYSLENGASFSADECAQIARLIDAAIKQHEQDKLDAARMEWYFGPSDKKDWLDTYMRGMREGWSVGQWRAAIDSAMAKESGDG